MTIGLQPDEATVRAWSAALDEIEASLRTAEDLIDDPETANVIVWAPPADLPPLPDALVPRARTLIQAVNEVAARVAEAHSAVGADLAQLAETGRNPGTRRAGYGDEVPSPRLVDHDA